MTRFYFSSGTGVKLFVHGIHIGACWGGFRTSARSNMEHFVTKKLANAFPEKQLMNLLSNKKKNIVAGKYPKTNTVKIPHEYFISFKAKHDM